MMQCGWETLIADDLLWELAYAPSVGHPARLSGRDDVLRHVSWFRNAVDRFRFFNLVIHPFEDPTGAVGEVEAEGVIKSTGRIYRQNYVVFIRVANGKIAFIREYFDPVRAAEANGPSNFRLIDERTSIANTPIEMKGVTRAGALAHTCRREVATLAEVRFRCPVSIREG